MEQYLLHWNFNSSSELATNTIYKKNKVLNQQYTANLKQAQLLTQMTININEPLTNRYLKLVRTK